MKRFFALIFLLTLCTAVNAQSPDDGLAFRAGESLRFKVSYRAAMWPNTDMGTVTMNVSAESVDGLPTLRVEAYATVDGMFRWFFKLDDYYRTWINPVTRLPVRASSDIREGGYRFSSRYDYSWSEGVSYNRFRNHNNPDPTLATVELGDGAMDGVSLFYLLRSQDFSTFSPGEVRSLRLMMDDKIRTIRYKFYGPEVRDIPGLGELSTLKFSCQLVTSEAQSFEEGSEFFLWVSNDRNKVPLYIDSPIRVGSIRARLVEYNGLKYRSGSVL